MLWQRHELENPTIKMLDSIKIKDDIVFLKIISVFQSLDECEVINKFTVFYHFFF